MDYMIAMSKRLNKKFALLSVDLDKFKPINDTYGHHVGDEVLVELARRMKAVVNRASDIIARTGGDEFVIALSDIETINTTRIGEIVELFRQIIYIELNEIQLSASIGVAIYPKDGEDFQTLYKKADARAYRVKKSGGNGYNIE